MLLGSPLRAEISRSGRASPDVRNADSSCDEWTTDLTRYGSRAAVFLALMGSPATRFGVLRSAEPDADPRNAGSPTNCRQNRRFCQQPPVELIWARSILRNYTQHRVPGIVESAAPVSPLLEALDITKSFGA